MTEFIDERTPPFFYVTEDAAQRIQSFERQASDPGLSQVIAVYYALIRICNKEKARDTPSGGAGSRTFTSGRQRIVHYSGTSKSTVDKATKVLVRLGLLEVERLRIDERQNLRNRYRLCPTTNGSEKEGVASLKSHLASE